MKKIISMAVAFACLLTFLSTGMLSLAATPPETTPDASTPNDLATIGTPYTENFTKNLINIYTYDTAHNYIFENDDSIAGKSLKLDFNGSGFGGFFGFGVANKLTPGAKYRISFDLKFISANAPTSLYVGLKSDTGGGEINHQVDFSGQVSNTIYNISSDFDLLNNGNYYLQVFTLASTDGSVIVIDNLVMERLYVAPELTPETTPDASTLDDLSTLNSPFTENFTKGAIGSMWSYDMTNFSIVSDEQAIAGKSLMQNFTNASFGGIYYFGTKFKFAAAATYTVTFSYKVLTDIMPTGMYIGFQRDGGLNQVNSQMDFTGNVKDTVYTYTHDFTLENFDDYYMQQFNLDGSDGSKIVFDTLTLEAIDIPGVTTEETFTDSSTLRDTRCIDTPFSDNFTKDVMNLYSYDMNHFSIIEGPQAIAGKSILQDFTNATFGGIYAFGTKGNLIAGGTYRLTVDYKVLTTAMPTGFYFGFTRDGGANQVNQQVDFTGKTKNNVYTFTHDFTLEDLEGYYLHWFNLSSTDGSKIVLDSFKVELLDTPSHYSFSYNITGANFMSGLTLNMNTASFLNGVQHKDGVSVTVRLFNKNDVELGANDTIVTGTKIEVNNGSETVNYTAVLKGDLNGDGIIGLDDLVKIRDSLLEVTPLEGAFASAANLYGESNITLNDLVGIMASVSESGTIIQN